MSRNLEDRRSHEQRTADLVFKESGQVRLTMGTIVWNTDLNGADALQGLLKADGLMNLKCFLLGAKPTGSKQVIAAS